MQPRRLAGLTPSRWVEPPRSRGCIRPVRSCGALELSTRESRCISVISTKCESATGVSRRHEAPLRRSEAG
jgi:hypothetical protein